MNEQPRVVTRVTAVNGSTINVRNDELEKYLADNPGAAVTGAPNEGEVVAEPQVEALDESSSSPRPRGKAE